MPHPASPSKLLAVAISEWLLVLPSALLLATAALRLMQPRQYEPARTSWVIFEWATTHISHAGAGLLFIGLPALAVVVGGLVLWMLWRGNETLRQDLAAALASLGRHLAIAVLATGTLLAGAILAAVLLHIITD
ncbi:MAG: hypothetical protein DMG39_09385 [Acidobacteria bacterium]|nr:MAG: hypothetical protein DMG39_09385 [Acidobacteriota bacterium]